MSGVELSIVSTLYCSEPYLRAFCERASRAAQAVVERYEILLVNDGSPDASLALALELQAADPRIVLVDLSRNFGHHRAMLTGMALSRGERVFLIDSDLEEPPEALGDFYRRMQAERCDMVVGVQERRKGGWFERVSGEAFYRLSSFLSDAPTPRNALMARLLTRRYVDALMMYREQVSWMDGLFVLAGFRHAALAVAKADKGASTYTLRRKVALAVDSITDFSDKPLHLIFYAGLAISFVAGAYVAYLTARKLIFDIPVDGWTSVIVSIWLLGGITILFLGVIGIYLAKVFIETKQRPRAVVRQVFRRDPDSNPVTEP